jgi:secretion/DNA translocation related TadE-like protein
VFAAMLLAAIIAVGLGGLWLGSAVVARHRAQTAADLAALAAAQLLPAGPAAACRQAESLATVMGARLESCSVERLDVTVRVGVTVGSPRGLHAGAVARAGPAVEPAVGQV